MWVSALLLLVMFVDTIVTAFLLGKYRQIARDCAKLRMASLDDASKKQVVEDVVPIESLNGLTPEQLTGIMDVLTGKADE